MNDCQKNIFFYFAIKIVYSRYISLYIVYILWLLIYTNYWLVFSLYSFNSILQSSYIQQDFYSVKYSYSLYMVTGNSSNITRLNHVFCLRYSNLIADLIIWQRKNQVYGSRTSASLVKVNSSYMKHKVWPRQPCCTG